MTATINNNTVAMNVADVLTASLRSMGPEELECYNDLTPTTLDYLSDYADGVGRMPYQLAIASADPRPVVLKTADALAIPGALTAGPQSIANLAAASVGTAPQKFISYPNNVLAMIMDEKQERESNTVPEVPLKSLRSTHMHQAEPLELRDKQR